MNIMPNGYGGRTRVAPFLNVTFDGLWIVHNGPIFRWPDSTPLPSKINSELFLGIHAGNRLGFATQRFKGQRLQNVKVKSFQKLIIILVSMYCLTRTKNQEKKPAATNSPAPQ